MRFIKTYLILAVTVVSLHTEAQILVGPIAGPQYSWTSFDDRDLKDSYNVDPVIGYHGGVAVSFLVRKRFFLHTAFVYSTKGKSVEGKEDQLLKHRARYNFIEMPVLYTVDFKANFGNDKQFKYYLGLGPNVSYWLGGKGEIYSSDLNEVGVRSPRKYEIVFRESSEVIGENEMVVADPNRIQLGLNVGAGFEFEPSPRRKIMCTFRYEFGHSFFSKSSNGVFEGTYYQDILQSRNNGFRFSVAYLFDLNTAERKKGKSTIKKRRL
jgi:hypothetical protein